MLRIGIFLVILGGISYSYSLSLDLFSNENEFMQKMDRLPDEDIDRAYYQLREEYVTDQPLYTDVGIICVSLGMFILIFLPKGLNSKTPRNKYYIILIGLASVLTTCAAYVLEIISYVSRWIVPPWADSAGIPLAPLPVIFLILLAWFLAHVIFLAFQMKYKVEVGSLCFREVNYYLLFLCIVMVILTITFIVETSAYFVIPSLLWLYFYYSMMVGRQRARLNQKTTLQNG